LVVKNIVETELKLLPPSLLEKGAPNYG